ncbi:unnamed protein product [marine sediment metagenome]|uniref:Uncharacterized protein n=1 Tax=marine sediment metagenome TaxID=412755 RepID=X1HDK1_9ZZZZ
MTSLHFFAPEWEGLIFFKGGMLSGVRRSARLRFSWRTLRGKFKQREADLEIQIRFKTRTHDGGKNWRIINPIRSRKKVLPKSM